MTQQPIAEIVSQIAPYAPPHPGNPVIPGCLKKNGKPRKRPGRQTKSAAEHEERINFCTVCLAAYRTKSELKQALFQRYGISARTAEDYISRAREKLRTWENETPSDIRNEVLNVLKGAMRGETAWVTKFAAIDRIVDLFGFNAAQRMELGGILGREPIQQITQIEVVRPAPKVEGPQGKRRSYRDRA